MTYDHIVVAMKQSSSVVESLIVAIVAVVAVAVARTSMTDDDELEKAVTRQVKQLHLHLLLQIYEKRYNISIQKQYRLLLLLRLLYSLFDSMNFVEISSNRHR